MVLQWVVWCCVVWNCVFTSTDEFLSVVTMSRMNFLFISNSDISMLLEPSKRNTRFTLLFVHSVKNNTITRYIGIY